MIEANITLDGAASLKIWLDNVNCNGNETMLDDCPHADLGIHDCTHAHDIGVGCDASDSTSQNGATAGIQLVGASGVTES